ncbi:MAG: 6-carboxyhexanoate--CoA ligase, partial [Staphylococcus epidermidis]|nr:6-carboxyhexanoate--CoA ligase [Staphylococcus epidermidis]
KDARALATCINAFEGVKAELCVSDDLHYTTGYYASPKLGYRRIFNIKEKGTRHGGRIIFVDEGINLNAYVSFLETVPKEIIEK